jgi:anti-sigma regulatory factor (Ser/Thr protein kinase)
MHYGHATITDPAPPPLTPPQAPQLYFRSYPGCSDQVRHVRAFLREVLAGLPRADDAVPIGSELAANACLHSRSGVPGGAFTVSVEIRDCDHLLVAVEDDGGQWTPSMDAVVPEHGLDLVQAIVGPGQWGVGGDDARRVVWARLRWPGTGCFDQPMTAQESAMPAFSVDDDDLADLQALAGELTARGLSAQLTTPDGRLPHLSAQAPEAPVLAERIYAQAGWFFWPAAERIATCDDLAGAAEAIIAVVRPSSGVSDA